MTGEVRVAAATVRARLGITGVCAFTTVASPEAQRAGAAKAVRAVHTRAPVGAGPPGTVVQVALAARTPEARPAAAQYCATQVQAETTCEEGERRASRPSLV